MAENNVSTASRISIAGLTHQVQLLNGHLDESVKKIAAVSSSLTDASSTGDSSVQALSSQADRASTLASSISAAAEKASGAIDQAQADIQQKTDAIQQRTFDALDALLAQVKASGNAWDKELAMQIQAVDAGAESIQHLLEVFGDAKIETKNGTETIRQYLDRLNLKAREQELQDYIDGLRKGTVTLDQVAQKLADTGFVVAKQLSDMLKAFEQGKASMDQIEALLAYIKQNFPNSQLADLGKTIDDYLRTHPPQ